MKEKTDEYLNLTTAIAWGDHQTFKAILDQSCNKTALLTIKNFKLGFTLLHDISIRKYNDLITHILKYKLNHELIFEAQTHSGDTVLHLIVLYNEPTMLKQILETIYPSKPTSDLNVCYNLSKSFRQRHRIYEFSKEQRLLTVQDYRGQTILHVACQNHIIEAVETILKHASNKVALLNIKNFAGKTAFELALTSYPITKMIQNLASDYIPPPPPIYKLSSNVWKGNR